MKNNKAIQKVTLLIGICLLLFTLYTIYSTMKTYEGFQSSIDCTSLTDCKTCANTYGCTFCSTANKCVSSVNQYSACPQDTYLNSGEDCIDCSKISDCKTCAGLNPCAWCKTSNKCVSSSQTNIACPGESTALNPNSCSVINYDISGIPYTFDISGSVSEIQNELDSGVYGMDTIYPQKTNNTNTTFDYSDISSQYPGTSIIPILGLSHDLNGHLSQSSLKTIIQSAKNSGYMINTSNSKQSLLDDITKETNFYINQKKEYMKKFLDNSIEYLYDATSLEKVKQLDIKIMDLNDISGFVKGINVNSNGFNEGYQNKEDSFAYTLQKNKTAAGYLQFLWIVNLIGIGTFVYFISK